MSPRISTHHAFDDDRYWRFQRQSGLPYGYFNRWRVSPDALVLGVSIGCLIVALMFAL